MKTVYVPVLLKSLQFSFKLKRKIEKLSSDTAVPLKTYNLVISFCSQITECINFKCQYPVVQTADSAVRWINHYPVDTS